MTTIMSRDGTRLISGIESAEQRLTDALAIRRGSYPWSRDYGSRLADIVDGTVDSDAEARIFAAVADAVAHPPNGLADVTLRTVRLIREGEHPDRVLVDVQAEWTGADGVVTPIGVRRSLAEGRSWSIWDPDLPLGDLSHVYAQGSEARTASRLTSPYILIVAGRSRIDTLCDGAVTGVQCGLRWRSPPDGVRGILRLSSTYAPGDEIDPSFRPPGPHLRAGVFRHLAFVFRDLGGPDEHILIVRNTALSRPDSSIYTEYHSPDDDDEPYRWTYDPSTNAAIVAWLDRIWAVPAEQRRAEVAVVWIGPGSVVDLEAGTTRLVGRAPRIDPS